MGELILSLPPPFFLTKQYRQKRRPVIGVSQLLPRTTCRQDLFDQFLIALYSPCSRHLFAVYSPFSRPFVALTGLVSLLSPFSCLFLPFSRPQSPLITHLSPLNHPCHLLSSSVTLLLSLRRSQSPAVNLLSPFYCSFGPPHTQHSGRN